MIGLQQEEDATDCFSDLEALSRISLDEFEHVDIYGMKQPKAQHDRQRGVGIVVSPYRVCPLGAHIDHQVVGSLQLLNGAQNVLFHFLHSNVVRTRLIPSYLLPLDG